MGPLMKPKDKNSEVEAGSSSKTLVILAKPSDKNRNSHVANEQVSSSPTEQAELKPPTVLLKSRDTSDHQGSRAASPGGTVSPVPGQNALPAGGKEDGFADLVKNVTQRVYHIQQKPTSIAQNTEGKHCNLKQPLKPSTQRLFIEPEQREKKVRTGDQKLAPPLEMPAPVKLVDESLQWCDSALEFLHDATDFYVIGVLGLQGTGKSTIMSIISGMCEDKKKCHFFKTQTSEHKERGEHCTTGIDIYVTNQRIILLDTQPVLSASVMDHLIQYEKKSMGAPDYHSTENALLMQSLQQAAFLMAVCHTIITVQDWFIDLSYIRFLLSAEMLKPPTPISPHELNPVQEETIEYYPHLVFVQNRCNREDFSPFSICKMQRTLHALFKKSKLKCSGSVRVDVNSSKIQEDYRNTNLFLLPEKSSDKNIFSNDFPEYKGHPDFSYLQESLSQQVMSMPRALLTHTALSEKNWFHYSARIWEAVKKSNLFFEYNRLLP